MRRFTIAPERIRDGRVVFDRDESRHLARVLRLRSGDTVLAADGAGHEYTVRLETVGDEATGVVLRLGTNEHESPIQLTLFQAVPKGDKMESIVRASTELGVTRVVPAGRESRASRGRPPAARRSAIVLKGSGEKSLRQRSLPIAAAGTPSTVGESTVAPFPGVVAATRSTG